MLLPLPPTYFKSVPLSQQRLSNLSRLQAPGSDSRAVDLASCLNLGIVRQGQWDFGERSPVP